MKYFKKIIIGITIFLLILLVIFTKYEGTTDIADYANTAKLFAGKYSADIRTSHSYLYGFLISPFLKFSDSFIIFKIINLIVLSALVYSVYLVSDKKISALLLIMFAPVIWYIAPWISPIPLASLLFFWAWFFMLKFHNSLKTKYLIFASILMGLSWAVWDTMLYFGVLLTIPFIYDKKVSHLLCLILFVFIGISPRLILNQNLFGFAFFDIIKTIAGNIVRTYSGDIHSGKSLDGRTWIDFILILLAAIPIYSYKIYQKEYFKGNQRSIIFILLGLLLILTNPQIRFVTIILPILIVIISQNMSSENLKKSIIFSLIILFFFMVPLFINLFGSIVDSNVDETTPYLADFASYVKRINHLEYNSEFNKDLLSSDLNEISSQFPNEVFLVDGAIDYYAALGYVYWGDEIKELVSIEDYQLNKKNMSSIFSRRLSTRSNIPERRQLWLEFGIGSNPYDETDYSSIKYVIGTDGQVNLSNFKLVKRYNVLSLYEKKIF